MKKYRGRLTGILGTVIIHLIAGIIFVSVQINALKTQMASEFRMELAPEEELETKASPKEMPVTTIEKALSGDKEMLNIAKNLADKPDVKISREDYIDKVKEELIKSGKLGKENYIDEQKQHSNDNNTAVSEKKEDVKKDNEEKPLDAAKMAANYKGPTRINYNLMGRTHLYLPIPIYKCQGAGTVTMDIDVDQKGNVLKASVIPAGSTTEDPCLIETAVNSALVSRFNSDVNAPKVQRGTLSYKFVAQ